MFESTLTPITIPRSFLFMKVFRAPLLATAFCLLMAMTIDLNNLFDYAGQTVPNYINPAKDNTPQANPITNAGATLGRVLFYDKNLSVNNTIACASCHLQ